MERQDGKDAPGPGPEGRPEGFRARLAWWLLQRPGSPFELLAERDHLIVRAEMRRTRRRRLATTLVCAAVPLLVAALALLLALAGGLA
jgi:hypothetical protein